MCVCPRAPPPVTEIPSSRRVVLPTMSVKKRVWAICVRNIAQAVLFRVITLPDLSVARERLRSVRF